MCKKILLYFLQVFLKKTMVIVFLTTAHKPKPITA